MDLLLKTVGGIVIAGGVLIGLVAVFFIWKFRRFMRSLGKAEATPSTITLANDAAAEWTTEKDAARALEELAALGWTRGPAYTIEEMPGVALVALHHPRTGSFGAYYSHVEVGRWADFCAKFADGVELTVSNAPKGGEMDSRPETRKLWLTGKPFAQLQTTLEAEIAGQTLKAYDPARFKEEFEGDYARDMAWRNAKGGTSEDEFMRVARNQNNDLTAEQLQQAYRETKSQEITRWSDEAIETFGQTTTLSVSEWKRFEGRMFILREDFHPHGYLDYLNDELRLGEDEVQRYRDALGGGLSLPGLLQRISQDTGHTFTPLGEVEMPSKTAVYGITRKPGEDDE